MTQRLCAQTERVQRPAAHVARPAGLAFFGMDTTTAWNAKPSVHATAICTFGKYHARRLREMPT